MMNDKIKKVLISFLMMLIFNLVISASFFWELGLEYPHVGLLFVLGLLFGPYGALGAVLANTILDFLYGYAFLEIIPSEIISFGIAYLAYKLWYSGFKTRKVTKPKLDTLYQLSLFLASLFICGFIYATVHGHLIGLIAGVGINEFEAVSYFLNFINIGFIFGIISIWLSKRIDFIETPKTSKRHINEKLYQILFCLLITATMISAISLLTDPNRNIIIGEITLIGILLYAYLTKPFEYKIEANVENTLIENIIHNFLLITLAIAILGVIISIFDFNYIKTMENIDIYIHLLPMLIISDIIIILFFVPGIIILKYIEQKVINPISSFSEIEKFIKEDEKIETEGLVNIYSKYINEKNEIGTLARSYTELIEHNNKRK